MAGIGVEGSAGLGGGHEEGAESEGTGGRRRGIEGGEEKVGFFEVDGHDDGLVIVVVVVREEMCWRR